MKAKLFISALLLVFTVNSGWGQIPKTISYQGNLSDAGGTSINGTRDLTFKIYESETGGTEIWSETQSSVSITNGKINVIMGVVNSLDIPFDKQYWLGISVAGGTELTPRCKLASVPYSFNTLSIRTSGGSGNLFIGTSAGAAIELGGEKNTGLGYEALKATTTGDYNTASGYHALFSNTTGGYNTASGYRALYSNTEGQQNTASGYGALSNNTMGYENTASGFSALFSNTTGQSNTACGFFALFSNTTGKYNIASGHRALYSNTTGSYNTASGNRALYSNTTGHHNTASGYGALNSNTTGYYNTACGYNALCYNTEGSYNTACGYQALFYNITAYEKGYNTALGCKAGKAITTGQYNVIIGADSDPSSGAAVNQIVIGYGAAGTGDNQIALGNTSITAIKGQVNFTTYSDRRIKRDIHEDDLGLALINELRPVKYKLKNPADYPEPLLEERFKNGQDERPQDDETVYDGLISQELKSALDKLGLEWSGWTEDENTGKQGIQYGALVVPLIKAVQELSAKVEELERKLNNLEETDTDPIRK